MTQREFARFFKEHMGNGKTFAQADKDIKGFMEAMQRVFTETEEDRIIIPGFGTFMLQNRKARKIKHPRTLEEIIVPDHKKVTFKTALSFNARINKKEITKE